MGGSSGNSVEIPAPLRWPSRVVARHGRNEDGGRGLQEGLMIAMRWLSLLGVLGLIASCPAVAQDYPSRVQLII
jgi:hypothetical protein